MLSIAGQTVEPIGLIFFCGHSWVAGGCYRLKNRKKISQLFLFFFNIYFSTYNAGPFQLLFYIF